MECVGNPGVCTRAPSVRDHIWTDLAKAMQVVLESTTLQDLVERQKKKDPCVKHSIQFNKLEIQEKRKATAQLKIDKVKFKSVEFPKLTRGIAQIRSLVAIRR